MEFSKLTKGQLSELLEQYNAAYEELTKKKLSLDLSRGKPGATQLDLLQGMLDCIDSSYDCHTVDGFDCRNYGVLDGIKEAKLLFANLLGLSEKELFIGGNSSLNLMYDTVARAMLYGVCDIDRPWCREDEIKFICPAPG